ncbi:MAG: hypothetical protein LBU65_11405 [Planctomycetaceae bacterium]|jgi:hypothetical protein|nr:hypothetical protein [Planctomycetaceae bacterium]
MPRNHSLTYYLLLTIVVFNFVTISFAVDDFDTELERLAAWCDGLGLTDEAAVTRNAILPHTDDELFIPIFQVKVQRENNNGFENEDDIPLPETVDKSTDNTDNKTIWQNRLANLRYQYGKKLFADAVQLAESGKGGDAVERLITVLRVDPDNAVARTFFGYTRHDGCWRTAWEVERMTSGFVEHPRFGWIKKEHVERYEKGQRLWKIAPQSTNKTQPSPPAETWITADEESERRHDIRNGWDIASEHFILRTSCGLEEGVKMSRRLEDFYRCWSLMFYRVYKNDSQLSREIKAAITGKQPPAKRTRHSVYVYRDKAEYIANLREIEPQVEATLGFYYPERKRSYFFQPDAATTDEYEYRHIVNTLLHEATHQLFQETLGSRVMPGQKNNFWLFEGVATYMESFKRDGDYYVLGGFDCDWMLAARYRFNKSKFYLPFEQITKMGQDGFQDFGITSKTGFEPSEKLRMLYSQSSGITHFLMHTENGRFREPTIQLLRRLYHGEEQPDSLSKLTGVTYKELDAKYKKYITRP